jgi:ethanolamine kinase
MLAENNWRELINDLKAASCDSQSEKCREEFSLSQVFTDGITNKLVGCFYSDEEKSIKEDLLVRIYGNKSELMIDRAAEKKNMAMLFKAGLAPELYATFNNGLVYEYVPGVTINYKTVQDPKIWPLVARNMAKMHKLPLSAEDSKAEPMLKSKYVKFLDLIPEVFSDPVKQQR